ncbi:6289_t:CDS:2 [Ambispora gerdemannii]|uniref:6289_t:CDS:1 n=1 Tax=Ambispora gerdemannii TaxID=144530 RepID=A0A9N9FZL8_9GLOM|nr:6289_t:CDS:2 [Ambispora gerdemannii]
MPNIIKHVKDAKRTNLKASSNVLNKDLNALTHITEKVSKESESEEHNGTVTGEYTEAEHIRVEVNYLDVGDFIENEIQELTIGPQIDGVVNAAY